MLPEKYWECYPDKSIFNYFMEDKLRVFSCPFQKYSGDHIIALFMLMPMLLKLQENASVEDVLESCFGSFLEKYQGEVELIDTNRMRLSLLAVVPDLLSEYRAFEANCLRKINSISPPAYTPGFNTQRSLISQKSNDQSQTPSRGRGRLAKK
jgi:hypothetical protein